MDFSLAGRRRPGKSASAFGGVSFMEKPRWSSQITAEKLPKGLRSFARSSSPDRAKKSLLCALCASVVNQNQRSLRLFTSVCPDDLLATAD